MITVKAIGKQATIGSDFKAKGDKTLSSALNAVIQNINPEDSQAANHMAFLFYELENRGFEVIAEKKDLEEIPIPKDAVS
jgi:hypothetical protein